MPFCWTCSSETASPTFDCIECQKLSVLTDVEHNLEQLSRGETLQMGVSALQLHALDQLKSEVSQGLSKIVSAIHWSTDQIRWAIEEQSELLRSIDHTLQTPSQTQGNEWRMIADELAKRNVLEDAVAHYHKSLQANPLDVRAYIGLGRTLIKQSRLRDAFEILENGLPHVPASNAGSQGANCRSYVERLLGHIEFCCDNVDSAQQRLAKAVAASMRDADAQYEYAQYSAVLGDNETVRAALKQAIGLKPFFWEAGRSDALLRHAAPTVKQVLVEFRNRIRDQINARGREVASSIAELETAHDRFAERWKFLIEKEVEEFEVRRLVGPHLKRVSKAICQQQEIQNLCRDAIDQPDYARLLESQQLIKEQDVPQLYFFHEAVDSCDNDTIHQLDSRQRSVDTAVVILFGVAIASFIAAVALWLTLRSWIGSLSLAVFGCACVFIGMNLHARVKHVKKLIREYRYRFLAPMNKEFSPR